MPKIRPFKKAAKGPAPPVILPKSMTLTDDEKSSVAQWIRLRRNKRIWIAALIQALLDWDSNMTYDPSGEDISAIIEELQAVYSRIANIEQGGSSNRTPPNSQHPAVVQFFSGAMEEIAFRRNQNLKRSYKPLWVVPESEEDQFYEILRPVAPGISRAPKKIVHPSGHLGREESGG